MAKERKKETGPEALEVEDASPMWVIVNADQKAARGAPLYWFHDPHGVGVWTQEACRAQVYADEASARLNPAAEGNVVEILDPEVHLASLTRVREEVSSTMAG